MIVSGPAQGPPDSPRPLNSETGVLPGHKVSPTGAPCLSALQTHCRRPSVLGSAGQCPGGRASPPARARVANHSRPGVALSPPPADPPPPSPLPFWVCPCLKLHQVKHTWLLVLCRKAEQRLPGTRAGGRHGGPTVPCPEAHELQVAVLEVPTQEVTAHRWRPETGGQESAPRGLHPRLLPSPKAGTQASPAAWGGGGAAGAFVDLPQGPGFGRMPDTLGDKAGLWGGGRQLGASLDGRLGAWERWAAGGGGRRLERCGAVRGGTGPAPSLSSWVPSGLRLSGSLPHLLEEGQPLQCLPQSPVVGGTQAQASVQTRARPVRAFLLFFKPRCFPAWSCLSSRKLSEPQFCHL